MDDLLQRWFSKKFIQSIWFSATPKDDEEIYDRFGHLISLYNPNNRDITKDRDVTKYPIQIVLLDQITRHIDRHLNQKDTPKSLAKMFARDALRMSLEIISQEKQNNYKNFFLKLSPEKQVMVLMPLRHTFEREYLEKSLEIINSLRENQKNNSIYRRFWSANIRSLGRLLPIEAYNPSRDPHPLWTFDQSLICPTANFDPSHLWNYKHQLEMGRNAKSEAEWSKRFQDVLGKPSKNPDVVISLSGGTDSMVASYNLKRLGYNVIAVMVVYNNRQTSQSELEFVKWWCAQIGIRLYYRQITEIKKSRDSDREFYESYTRELRFSLYRYVYELLEKPVPIVLGHNLDDTLENLFTNLRKSLKIENLLGMNSFHEENGILIYRPMLETWKDDIMKYAREHGIPYLYDSTPRDCWRGILRHQVVLPILNLERGDQILKSLHKLAVDMRFMVNIFNQHVVENTPITITDQDNIKIELIEYNDRSHFIYWDLIFDRLRQEPYNLVNKPKVGNIRSLVERLDKIEAKKQERKKNYLKHNNRELINLETHYDGIIYPDHIEIVRTCK